MALFGNSIPTENLHILEPMAAGEVVQPRASGSVEGYQFLDVLGNWNLEPSLETVMEV